MSGEKGGGVRIRKALGGLALERASVSVRKLLHSAKERGPAGGGQYPGE